jgi:hypothetical protein
MAKVTGPLMSLDASGTVGKTAVFSKWKGRNYVRLRVIPMNKQSTDQQDARIRTGSVGRSISVVPVPKLALLGSDFYVAALAAAPAGQSWASYTIRTCLGSGFSTFDDVADAYAAVNPTNQGYFATSAATAGLNDFAIAKVGAITSVTAAEQLYRLMRFAIDQLDYPDSALGLDLSTQLEVTAFQVYLTTRNA